jgi:hypothetical protein
METKDIKELMLSSEIMFEDKYVYLYSEINKFYYLDVISKPEDSYWYISVYDKDDKTVTITDEQYNMICKHVENEYYEHHSNNTAFTDDDIEHFNSLIN